MSPTLRFLVLFFCALLLAACGSSDGNNPTPAPIAESTLPLLAHEPDDSQNDSLALADALSELQQMLQTLTPSAPTVVHAMLRAAVDSLNKARGQLQKGGTDATYLSDVLTTVAQAQQQLELAMTTAPPVSPLLLPAVQSAREAAKRLALAMIEFSRRAGVPPRRMAAAEVSIKEGDKAAHLGAYALAINHYAEGLGFAANVITFSMDSFERNLKDALAGKTVGYAYAINQAGLLARSGADGRARTSAEDVAPDTPQLPTKRMNIASISKTITATAVLKLLEQQGISVDTSVANYLPLHWQEGPNINTLSFKDLLTHTSGLNDNKNEAYDYESLRTYVDQGVDLVDKTYKYQNANFALFRMIIPYLWQGSFKLLDPDSYPQTLADMYVDYVSSYILEPMGINGAQCKSSEANPTLLYQFGSDSKGKDPGDWTLVCGGGGWNLSAYHLAAFLAHLRYDDAILSPATRQLMDDERLGWIPIQGANSEIYLSHGGDLWYPKCGKGMTGAIMNFPINVQVSLLINSLNCDLPSKNNILKDAYEGAWIAAN